MPIETHNLIAFQAILEDHFKRPKISEWNIRAVILISFDAQDIIRIQEVLKFSHLKIFGLGQRSTDSLFIFLILQK